MSASKFPSSDPPFGKSIDETFQQPKAVELFEDDVVVIWKNIDAPGYVDGVKGAAHPDTAAFPNHKLDTIIPAGDGVRVKWTYVRVKAPLVSYESTPDQQTATKTVSRIAQGTAPVTLNAKTEAVDENLSNGEMRRTVRTVPDVFPAAEFSTEIPDLVPPEFRDQTPTKTTGVTVEGDAEPPVLAVGELAKSEVQETEFKKRTKTKARDVTALPVTLTDKNTSEAFGFGGVMDFKRTLDKAEQAVEEGINVVESKVKHLGGGLTLKETEKLSGTEGATLQLTAGGSGYTSNPTVAFSGGGASGGGAATASVSGLTTPTPVVTELTYIFKGDEEGAFFFIGKSNNNGVWRNPHTAGNIVVSAPLDALELGTFASIVDREVSNTYLVKRNQAELRFDLGSDKTLICKAITFRQRANFNSPCTSFSLQGSTNGTTWSSSDIVTVSGDASEWTTFKTTPGQQIATTPYRYFRIILPNGGNQLLSIGEFEMYGTLSVTSAATGGSVTGVTITSGGQYVTPPTVTFSGGGGTGAAGTAVLSGSAIIGVDITNPGNGYTSAPTIGFTGGVGSGASATATIAKTVASVSISDGGAGYSSPPQVRISGGGGSGAAAIAKIGNGVAGVVISASNANFTGTPSVAFTGGGGTGAAGTAVRGFALATTTITANGSGYLFDPVITLSGGGGRDAALHVLRGLPLISVTVKGQGSGYTSDPTVAFSGGGGSGAVAAAVRSFGVNTASVSAGGSGFTSRPVVTLSSGSGTGATAEASVENGVTSIAITAGGTGYTSAPTVAFSGGGGTGAAGTATFAAGAVTGVTITNPGTGYTSAPTIAFSGGGGTGAAATATISGYVSAVSITNEGTGYETAPTVAFSGGGGSGAAATSTLKSSGVVKRLNVSNLGSGYSTPPAVTISGGGGTGATASALLNTAAAGTVKAIVIDNPGSGYTSAPALAISGGGGTGATATCTLSTTGQVTGVTMTNPGSGYSSPPTVTFSGGGGTGVVGNSVLSTRGALTSIEVTSPGSGYTTAPTVDLIGGPTGNGNATISRTYVSNGDSNGVFYFIGTNFGTIAWTNPHTAGGITVSASNLASGTLASVVDRATSDTFDNNNIASPWWQVDLGSTKTLICNKVSYRQRSSGPSSNSNSFDFQGSNNGSTWTTLSTQSSVDTTPDAWTSFIVSSSTAYRYFRLIRTGITDYFTIGELELYGDLTYPDPAGDRKATVTANLSTTGSVFLLTLTSAGVYLTPPTVSFSGGGGTGAAALYIFGSTWPVLQESHTDPIEAIVVLVEKRIVAAGTLYPGTGFVEIQALDKWRSIQLTSRIDLSTLPIPEVFESSHNLELPDYLLGVSPVWEESTSTNSRVNTGFSSSSVSATVSGEFIVQRLSGFRGAALASVHRTFFFGIPPIGQLPKPTIIQPSSGTAKIVTRSVSDNNSSGTTGGFSYVEQGHSDSSRIQVIDINNVLTAGISLAYNSDTVNLSGQPLDASANAIGIDTSFPNFASSSASATGSFVVFIPASNPAFVYPGAVILAAAVIEKWRLGVYVQTLIYVTVPSFVVPTALTGFTP